MLENSLGQPRTFTSKGAIGAGISDKSTNSGQWFSAFYPNGFPALPTKQSQGQGLDVDVLFKMCDSRCPELEEKMWKQEEVRLVL